MSLPKLPPGQQLTARDKWPTVGEAAPSEIDPNWSISITGCVESPVTVSLTELLAMPQTEQTLDIHCVTRWSKLDMVFTGVLLKELLALATPTPDAKFISFVAESEHDHSTSLPLSDALELGTMVVLTTDGEPLSVEHGGPVRTVVPKRYFYKSLKWLKRIELLAEDKLGFWEAESGYHNDADPWKEERFLLPGISKQEAAKIIDTKNMAAKNLPGINLEGRDLSKLNATEAILRNANFCKCDLSNADFAGANLSGALLCDSNLQNASFKNADIEGVNLAGADLRGVDFRGASLLAVSLCNTDESADALPVFAQPAIIDSTTKFDDNIMEMLMPHQQAFLQHILKSNDSE